MISELPKEISSLIKRKEDRAKTLTEIELLGHFLLSNPSPHILFVLFIFLTKNR